jgi:nitrite reductase/ring-hydroxylating ferredoxin subunit/uncharacterized membrane protein
VFEASSAGHDAKVGPASEVRVFPFSLLDKLDDLTALDMLSRPLSRAVRAVIRPPSVADALHGTWLGHPVHPFAVQLPIGSWTSSTLLDLVGGKDAQRGADALALTGVVTALPAVAAGLNDWSTSNPSTQRTGLVHAMANSVGLALWTASVLARRRGDRTRGALLGAGGLAAVMVGGTIGGHLSYRQALGADHNADIADTGPTDWTDAGPAEVPEGRPVLRDAAGTPVVVVRKGDRVHGLVDRCSHQSGPLHQGELSGGDESCLTCPWHGSTFRLEDGAMVHGPAVHPQPALLTRTQGERLEVRLRG